MVILGVFLMTYGFGGLIAEHVFGRDFGLFARWFEGGTLTGVSVVAGILGLVLVVNGIRQSRKKQKS